MALVKGPFELKWGDNVIENVTEIDVEYTVNSEDYETVQGTVIELDGSTKAVVTLTLLGADIPVLAALLPQNYVANGQVMSTGETVNDAQGAIDVVPLSCDEDTIFNHLDVISCSNPGNVMRLVNARTRLDDVDTDNKVRTVMIKFIGEVEGGEATIQFFREGSINVVS